MSTIDQPSELSARDPNETHTKDVLIASVIETKPPAHNAEAPSDAFLRHIPHTYARQHLVLSCGCKENIEQLHVTSSTPASVIFNIGVRLECQTNTTLVDAEHLATQIDAAYATNARTQEHDEERIEVEGSDDVEADIDRAISTASTAERNLLSTTGKAPAIRLVDLILFQALTRRASDIHIQPLRDRALVRYRLDGALHTVRELPPSLAASVVSRIKVMAQLDVAEKRSPQDGRAMVIVGQAGGTNAIKATAQRSIDLRVSTLPSTYGERVVLRLLDPSRSPHLKSFFTLGMPQDIEQRYKAEAGRTHGIVLSTGPTGSGKTTTLYATLAWLSTTHAQRTSETTAPNCDLNMMTIEDPVEYDLSTSGLSISQTQVDPKKNLTFATGLRHILRQDPDVIMVGEIRDEATAKIAVQSSLTGHLVLSTLHTNDAASAVARLLDLGVEPFLVASSLAAVLAQRLVRCVHTPCKGNGCVECYSTGYAGRIGVFELLVLNDELRDMVVRRAPALELRDAACRAGMRTLRDEGLKLVDEGITTRAEIARTIDAQIEHEEMDAAATLVTTNDTKPSRMRADQ